MKMFFRFLFFALFFVQISFSQSHYGKVTYEVDFYRDKIPKKGADSKSFASEMKVAQYMQNSAAVTAFLLFNKKESLYFVEKKLDNDVKNKINLLRISAGSKNLYYSDIARKYNIVQTDITGSTTRISYKDKEWTLTKETKEIEGFLCYKAILKSKPSTIAWYAPSIPINHGPHKYNNLPGLILELSEKTMYWVVRKIEFNNPEAKTIIEPNEGKLITSEEFKKISKDIFRGY